LSFGHEAFSVSVSSYFTHPGEPAAGTVGFTDTVTIAVESGDPGGGVGEFVRFMRKALDEWYDGAEVTVRPSTAFP
jgi:hypothetical protein